MMMIHSVLRWNGARTCAKVGGLSAVLLCSAVAQAAGQSRECLHFEPAVVTLRGRVRVVHRFGPPNFGETPGQDERLRVPMLRLAQAVTVCGDAGSDMNGDTQHGVRDVQLVMLHGSTRPWYGKRVEIRGTLFTGHTGYHFTRVLMVVQHVSPLAGASTSQAHAPAGPPLARREQSLAALQRHLARSRPAQSEARNGKSGQRGRTEPRSTGRVLRSALESTRGCSRRCGALAGSGTWSVRMTSAGSDYDARETVEFGAGGGASKLVATAAGGQHEVLDYPVTVTTVAGDSVHLSFAPIGCDLRWRCEARGRIVGRFSVPQPPFTDITGTWVMRQTDSAGG